MWKTIVRRFLILIPQLFVLSLVIFGLAQIMPGDALRGLVGPDTPQSVIDNLREIHGLNDPWYIQYGRWIRDIFLHGDFGTSLTHSRPVTTIIGERIFNTMRLSLLTTLFTYMIAIPLGLLAGRKNGTPVDKSIMVYTFIALSMPTVVFSTINLLIFAFNLGWFPTGGSVGATEVAGTVSFTISRIHHLILPAISLALISTISIIYFLRSEIVDYEASDFVLTARAKGVPDNKVYTNHILRNSFLPIAGGMGAIIAGLFGGSIFIETIFSYPGMGELFLTAVQSRDFPVVNTLVMLFAIMSAMSMLFSDIIITIVDPRIRIK